MRYPAFLFILSLLLLVGCATPTVGKSDVDISIEEPVQVEETVESAEEAFPDEVDSFVFEEKMPGTFFLNGEKVDTDRYIGKVGILHSNEEDGLYRIDIEGEESLFYSPEEGKGRTSLFDRSDEVSLIEVQQFLNSFEKDESLCFGSSLTIVGESEKGVEISNGLLASRQQVEEIRGAAIYLPKDDIDTIAVAMLTNSFLVRTFPEDGQVVFYKRAYGSDANVDLGLYYEAGKSVVPVLFLDYLVKEGIKPTKVTVSSGNVNLEIKGVESTLAKKTVGTGSYYIVTSTIKIEDAVDLLLESAEEGVDVHFVFKALFGSEDMIVSHDQLASLYPLLELTRIDGRGRVHFLNLR